MNQVRAKVVIAVLVLGILTSGCSNSSSDSNEDAQSSQSTDSLETSASDWSCDSNPDGLGETFSCITQTEDGEGIFWSLVLMCTSDLRTLHSIVGLFPSTSNVLWPTDNTVKIRIDSGSLEYLRAGSKGSGKALAFEKTDGDDESVSTWNFMSKIASAETFGFKATDDNGNIRSALFNVEGSIPIAAKFSVMGCKSS